MNLEPVRQAFQRRYGREPALFYAPGRVNLIGEHTDYNEGFVLPLGIERGTVAAVAPREDRRLRVASLELPERAELDLDAPGAPRRGAWFDYVEGVARALEERSAGLRLRGVDLLVHSDVPHGAGLSSSAALEISVGLALLTSSGHPPQGREDWVRLAQAGQRAEHTYVGTKCGLMDQLVSALARPGAALLIDCRSLETRAVPLTLGDAGLELLICDTRVRHSLASSEYNTRREECARAVEKLSRQWPDIRSLRDVSPARLEEGASRLSEVELRRARHVVFENERTLRACEVLERSDWASLGALMARSHRSLRDDYQVSCVELDVLAETAWELPGVIGARMTGGGFGGALIALVARDARDEVEAKLSEAYARRFGTRPGFLGTAAATGARALEPAAATV